MASIAMHYKNNKRLVLIIDVGNDIIYLFEFSKNKYGILKNDNFVTIFVIYRYIK